MPTHDFLTCLLDSLKGPVLFADTDHVVRYANRAARQHYTGVDELIGESLLRCHNEVSCQKMVEVLARLQDGVEEELIVDNEKHRVYMRAVRDATGCLLGYYERYDPPRGQ